MIKINMNDPTLLNLKVVNTHFVCFGNTFCNT
jgi:hypothetical protein